MTHITNFKQPKITKAEGKRHMSKVAKLPCVVCGDTTIEVHHATGGGMGMKSSAFDTFSLCVDHHRGQNGIHTIGKKVWEDRYRPQADHVRETLIKISGEE